MEVFRDVVFAEEEDETRILDLLDAHLMETIKVERMNPNSRNTDSENISAKMRELYRRRRPKKGNEWLLVTDNDKGPRGVQQTLDET